jgi:Zn-dependent protease
MKWSFKLGRFFGIDVYIHFTFLLLLGFIGIAQYMAQRNPAVAISSVVFFLSLFLCVLLHEFGHALAARGYGISTHDITLLPIGGVARLESMPEKPSQELWVAIAGPLVNVVIAIGLFIGLSLKGNWQLSFNAMSGSLTERLLVVNVFLVLFNLLPAFPMDGGRVLRALLALRLPYARATRVAATIGQAMAFLFGFLGLFGNPMLLLIALFVWIGASQEAAAVEMKYTMSGSTVRDAMLTHFRTLSPQQTLGDAARHLLAGSQQDFPVVDHDQLVGMLVRKDLFAALQERGELVPVAAVMSRDLGRVDPEAPLDSALGSVKPEKGATTIPVMEEGRLVGLLTAENVGEFFMIRAALEKGGHHLPPARSNVPPVIAPFGGYQQPAHDRAH